MENNKYSIVSIESGDIEEMFDYVDKDKEEKLLARRRYFKLFCIPFVFFLSFGLLVMSVIHDIKLRAKYDRQMKKNYCPGADLDCTALPC